jgi:Family of unknown function (DUF5684)
MSLRQLVVMLHKHMNYLIFIVIYVFVSVSLYRIACRLSVPYPWMAVIPIAREWLIIKMVGRSWKWFVLILIPLLNIVIAWLVWGDVARKLNRSVWYGRLMILPLFNILLIGVLAYEVTPRDLGRWIVSLLKWFQIKLSKRNVISNKETIEAV